MEIKINLLPEEKKREVRKKKQYHLIVWQSLLFGCLLVFYLGILLGIRFMLDFQLKGLENIDAIEAKGQAFQEIDAAEKKFQEVNAKIGELTKFRQEHILWSRLFVEMDRLIPEGILFDKVSTTDRKVSVSGKAETRDILLKFQEKLNGSECFRDARVPLSDLFSQKDIDFQLDVEMKQECLKPKNL